MAKLSRVNPRSNEAPGEVAEPFLMPEVPSAHHVDGDEIANEDSLNQNNSPSHQLHRKSKSRAPLSPEDMAAIATRATKALRLHETQSIIEQSVQIINNALEERSRTSSMEVATAIAVEPSVAPMMKRKLEADDAGTPSKRPRGRPRKTATNDKSKVRLSSSPLDQSQKTNSKGTKAQARSAREDVFNIPNDPPPKPAGSFEISKQTRRNPKVADTVTLTYQDKDFESASATHSGIPAEPIEPTYVQSKPVRRRELKTKIPSASPGLPISTRSNPYPSSTHNLRHRSNQSGRSTRPQVSQPTDWSKKPEASVKEGKRIIVSSQNRSHDSTIQANECSHHPDSPAISHTPLILRPANARANPSLQLSTAATEANAAQTVVQTETADQIYEQKAAEITDEPFADQGALQPTEGPPDSTLVEAQNQQETDSEYSEANEEDTYEEDESTVISESRRNGQGAVRALELLRADDKWERVVKAAESVGHQKRKVGSSIEHVVPDILIKTATMKTILKHYQKAREAYQLLATSENLGHEMLERTRAQLNEHLSSLKFKIENLKNRNPNRRFVQDIYAHGSRKMVFLVKHAAKAQAVLYSADEEYKSVEEIRQILDLVIAICELGENARKLKGKLPTEVPMVGQTSRQILPLSRNLREAFDGELETMRLEKHMLKEEATRRENLKSREAKWEAEQQRNQAKKEQKHHQQVQDVQDLRGLPIKVPHRPTQEVSSQRDQWTKDHNTVLIRLLMKFADQPVERRYVSVLNTPLLQNKLPEHIKQQALELKPTMEKSYMEDGDEIPYWVSSLA
ncbi:hypothetical protein MMC13_006517 [Lambiella insularis]|nr:hypothetical protein [Lambiella insularis]